MTKTAVGTASRQSLENLALAAHAMAENLVSHDDWMSTANAQSARALSELAREATLDEPVRVDDLKAVLIAAVGAADLALGRVNQIVAALRERAEEARSDAESRVEESRARITRLQEELPSQFDDIRERLSSEELRKFADSYAEAAQTTYTKLIERGEAALERLRSQPGLEEAASRVEGYTDQAVELTQEALGNVATQTRAVGERAAKLVGVELPKKAEDAAAPVKKTAKKAPARKAPAKKAPAKKTPARKTARG